MRHMLVFISYFFPMKIMNASQNLDWRKTPTNLIQILN